MLNEGNQTKNCILYVCKIFVIPVPVPFYYGSGSDFLTSYGSLSGSIRQKVTFPIPVPQHWIWRTTTITVRVNQSPRWGGTPCSSCSLCHSCNILHCHCPVCSPAAFHRRFLVRHSYVTFLICWYCLGVVLRIRDVYPGSRIRLFSIRHPGSEFFHPGSRIRIKEF